MGQPDCDCAKYEDLPLDLLAINARVKLYRTMRPHLKQLSQKMVERWTEHYRLYECPSCGQRWQATLAPRDSDTWYLFKVPKISIKEWQRAVFVPAGEIAEFVEAQAAFLAKRFETSMSQCNEPNCAELAIARSVKCMYHQFLQIGGRETLHSLQGMRWFPPYHPEMLQPNHSVSPIDNTGSALEH